MPKLAPTLPTTGHYLVVVSGDLASVVLLHVLITQSPDLRLRIVSNGDNERFVRQLAIVHGLAFEVGAPRELLVRHRAKAIITTNDSSIGQSIRPLQDWSDKALTEYAQRHGLAWREARERDDRAEPLVLSDSHSKLLAHQGRINQLLERKLARLYQDFRTPSGVEWPRRWLAAQSWAKLEALFGYSLRRLDPASRYSRPHIASLVQAAKSQPAGRQISLKNGLKLLVGYDKVALNVDAGAPSPQPVVRLVPETSVTFGPFQFRYGTYHRQTAEQITLPPGVHRLRPPQSGDRMQTPRGLKKLQDIFVDAKVPQAKRQLWPVIINESDQILWLPWLMRDPALADITTGYHLIVEEL